jgi:hypothetical protein
VGQWVTGLHLFGKPMLYRGQFLGFDNIGQPIINMRFDNALKPLDWKAQFQSNKPLRQFAIVKGNK